jgi:uncharacterized repeat protein (TIGR03803 family)
MRFSKRQHLVGLCLCSAWLLGSCGGGDGTSMYSVGGTLSGLASGASVVLQDSGGNDTTVSANGSFTFSTQVANNAGYAVTVLKQPTGQTCTVTSGSGSVSGANVTSVGVACDPATESVIHAFDVNRDGLDPVANVVQGSDGNFYGTTRNGGTSNFGTVFKVTPAGVETVLHFFAGGTTDGSLPTAALIQGSDGNFYGTTSGGGSKGAGTVFSITPAGVETVLYSFGGGITDGSAPKAALILGGDGNLYGTTSNGGTSGSGTVFRITPAGVETVLHSFGGGAVDGSNPNAALVLGSDGNFYGTTIYGGTNTSGTVFKITPAGIETVLYSFDCSNTAACNPNAALIQGSDGNFYGTTTNGGPSFHRGTVFKITPAGIETVLYSFACSNTDGCMPNAALIQGSDGNFYGTTSSGGPLGAGTVFKITPAGVETVLHLFPGGNYIFEGGSTTDGVTPNAALILGSDGNFYGTTSNGGTGNSGSLFKIALTGTETVVYSFNTGPEGQHPVGLIQGADGNFYGTTSDGGTSNLGTVFEITSTGVETVLHSFVGGDTDGSLPAAALIQGSDGNFYGTTSRGGTSNLGTVFKITPGGTETVLYSFAGGTTDGWLPLTALIEGSDGNFYGTTTSGGTYSYGTMFKVTPAGVETVLHSFGDGVTPGSAPSALIQGGDGNFYGTTPYSFGGTVFKISPSGVETVLHTFAGAPTDGSTPNAGLVLGSDGNFYGTTSQGGTSGYGTVFKITPGGVETVLYSFAGGTADGSRPNTALIQGNDGNFYGTTASGGIGGDVYVDCSGSGRLLNVVCAGNGTLFRITPAGAETMLFAFPFPAGTDGTKSNPGALILGVDGILYGTTLNGGSTNLGTVFKF